MKNELYYIIDNHGRYYAYNDYNGKAAMIEPNKDGSPPSIARAMQKEQAEIKIEYLMKYTKNDSNSSVKNYYHNHFSSLELKQIKDEKSH